MIESLSAALERLASFLADVDKPVAVIGGIAVIARVGTRPTEDVDLVMGAKIEDVDAILAAAKRHGYGFDPDALELAALGLVRLWGGPSKPEGVGVDLLFADNPYYESILSRATVVDIGGVRLPVATAEDLVLLKLEANRPLDIDDILAIKDAFEGSLDFAYLAARADDLGVRDKLDLYFGRR